MALVKRVKSSIVDAYRYAFTYAVSEVFFFSVLTGMLESTLEIKLVVPCFFLIFSANTIPRIMPVIDSRIPMTSP